MNFDDVKTGVELAFEYGEKIKKFLDNLDSDAFRDRQDTWLFFEGPHATQQIAGSLPRFDAGQPDSKMTVKAKDVSWFKNDEARSVLVQNAMAGDVLMVYDSPNGSGDDWARIRIKKDVGYMVIGTFEQTFENELYEIHYHQVNGLDGKISRALNYFPGDHFTE